MITFDVLGHPAPKGSKRHVGHGVMIESSKLLPSWTEAIKAAIIIHSIPLTKGDVRVECVFRLTRPKAHYGSGRNAGQLKASAAPRPSGHNRGDLDKLERAVWDALKAGGAITDDALVCSSAADKRWCTPDEPEGALITISSL